jgi:trans-2-enoyl-CoA reductase
LTTIDNPEKFRSPFSDPVVLGALVSAGGVVLSTLITAFATIYNHRKDKNKSNGEGSIIINLYSEKLPETQVYIPLDNFKLEEHRTKIDELELHPEYIENINYSEEP